ncbi:uncharacterized protein F4822DRAFT_90669 [Hypoxylon trugodes]|uniref:uncharacterized protein n=1 Tax=Hypoxylon trugodes TaxID=326681 RepID=UPI0021930200|nr:uncharacterized protein F4822DRAFT_90669 [Hypoxylon trugodes]KAI1383036.1 hypothetical protein F4822DRAFT_90669 [Hypoxylon trugodes]
MTSRFVSGGTIAGDGEPGVSTSTSKSPPPQPSKGNEWDKETAKKNSEWEAVQRDLEADRRRREEARRAQVEGGGGGERSLYDVLQANKAAKQAAFEEQNRIRNQFRALDDDEIEFLDGLQDERRTEEERVKRETEERLAQFREAQKAGGSTSAEGADGDGDEKDNAEDDAVAVEWSSGPGKKRKRGDKETRSIVKGVKRRTSELEGSEAKASSPETKTEKKTTVTHIDSDLKAKDNAKPMVTKDAQEKPKLGLVDYGSDDDDDD